MLIYSPLRCEIALKAPTYRAYESMTHGNAVSERTFSRGNNTGKVLSVILSQWLNVY